MAACRRVLHALRHAQLLPRTSVALVQSNASNGFGHKFAEAEVGTSSSSSSSSSCLSARCWQEERLSVVARDVGWSSWRLLISTTTSRGLHGTAWREGGEDEKELRSEGGVRRSVDGEEERAARVANEEARNLVQQVHLASLRKKLRDDSRDTISYEELLELCQTVGMASDKEEALKMAHAFNEAGVVITFRDKVHLHPEKVSAGTLSRFLAG